MKLITYTSKKEEYVGAVIAQDKIVVPLDAADRALARKEKRQPAGCFDSMLSLLGAGARGMSAARKAVKAVEDGLGDSPKPTARPRCP